LSQRPTAAIQQSISDFVEPISIDALPERFLRFCRLSIENKRGEVLYTEPDVTKQFDFTSYDAEYEALELGTVGENEIFGLTPTPSTRTVAAIDTSTMRLGELEDGSLCALRGAVVLLQSKQYKYVRYGPLVFTLSNSMNVDEIPGLGLPTFGGALNIEFMLRRVRNSLERWLQLSFSKTLIHAILLVDGSLTAGTPDNSSSEMANFLEIARQSDNLVIAISKNTQLRINDKSITALLDQNADPCILDVDKRVREQFPAFPIQFLGRVFVGKLARGGFPFRMDVDRNLPTAASVAGINQLAGTDIVDQGYPETLRIAHILSTFTASDVLAIQSIATRFGVQLMPKFALRRSLFGPFGTGWETRH
jgi:hypothetical protein